jgi:Tfp pilus assembly protein PilF
MTAKNSGQMEDAAAKFREALQIDPSNEDANWGLAWVLAMQGKKSDAATYMKKVVASTSNAQRKALGQAALKRLGAG